MSDAPALAAVLQPAVEAAEAELSQPLGRLTPERRAQARRVFAASPFVRNWCLRHPERIEAMLQGDLPPLDRGDQREAFEAALRRYRNQAMVRIAWQELAGLVSPEQTVTELSALAELCIQRAVDFHRGRMLEKHGVARLRDGGPAGFTVIALGKLGGRELNFSSDVDVIFAYEGAGESDGARPLSNEQYFVRLGQQIVASLQDRSAEGFVFRVDLRLRPFGEKSPIAHHLPGLEDYYAAHGRGWERYAWIKARAVAGDLDLGRQLITTLQPFVYRRYLDYGAIAALREMKQQIDEQVRARGHEQDIKLGWGGIREVEFIVQVFQLMRGGAEPGLRSASIMQALEAIDSRELYPAERIAELREAYWFLRRLENCWQAQRDQQSHVMPNDEEPRQALACALGFADWDALDSRLQLQRARVHAQFAELFAQPDERDPDPEWLRWWEGRGGEPPPARASDQMEALRERANKRLGQGEQHHRLGELLFLLSSQFEDEAGAERVLAVLDNLVGRGNYISLLADSGVARRALVNLCSQSAWLAQEIRQYPMVLSELLDPTRLYAPLQRDMLREQLQANLASLPAEDIEGRMDVLRRVRHVAMLRIAAADVSAALPIMRVSDRLSELAEEIVGAALGEARRQMQQRYPELPELEFAVIAYGKLGGLELGYTSDLDLVFVYDAEQSDLPLDPAVFYTRLVKHLIHFLATPTGAGTAYEIDTRLRPSGRSGLLVTSLQGLERYQREQAWTWEHQALIRARPVAGSVRVGEAFCRLREEILGRPRELATLRGEVEEMREKMREELGPRDGDFQPKQSPGGIVDIEFLVQFAVLAHCASHPQIGRFTDVIRICEELGRAGLIAIGDAQALAEAYRELRALVHQRFLRGEEAAVVFDSAAVQSLIARLQAQLSA